MLALVAGGLAVADLPASGAETSESRATGDGIGDPYWPLDGNSGIDVASYRIKQAYS